MPQVVGPTDNGGVCLHGHTDVVPVEGQPWQTDPFRLTERDGLLFGRGTSDMKAWLACSLAAVPSYRARPLQTAIHLAFSYDEEIGCLGAPGMIAAFGKSLPKPRIALIGEPSSMAPIIAHKGLLGLETTITGRAAHSSLVHLGVGAVSAAAEMAAELHLIGKEWSQLPGPHGMQPSGPTVSVGKLSGGVARNVIPREARLSWELRFRAGDAPDVLLQDATARIEARLRASFAERFDVLSVQTSEASVVFREWAPQPPYINPCRRYPSIPGRSIELNFYTGDEWEGWTVTRRMAAPRCGPMRRSDPRGWSVAAGRSPRASLQSWARVGRG